MTAVVIGTSASPSCSPGHDAVVAGPAAGRALPLAILSPPPPPASPASFSAICGCAVSPLGRFTVQVMILCSIACNRSASRHCGGRSIGAGCPFSDRRHARGPGRRLAAPAPLDRRLSRRHRRPAHRLWRLHAAALADRTLHRPARRRARVSSAGYRRIAGFPRLSRLVRTRGWDKGASAGCTSRSSCACSRSA